MKKPASGFWRGLTKNKSILGINLSIGSMLKQSQVFTGAISSLLQIIGAMVDVMIAPWIIPLFLPLVKKMSAWIPKIREWSQKLAEKYVPLIKDIFSKLFSGEGTLPERIGQFITDGWDLIWETTGLSKWWGEQTGILGLFTKYLTGVTKAVNTVWGIFTSITAGPFDNIYANIALKLGILAAGFMGGPITFLIAIAGISAIQDIWGDVDLSYAEPPPPYKSLVDKTSGGNIQSFGYDPNS